LRAFDDLVRSGKVRYIGCSNYRAWEVAYGVGVSKDLGLDRWVAAQNRWNLPDGLDSPELEQAAEFLGIGIVPYTPLASGILTGKYRLNVEPEAGTRFADLPSIRSRLTGEKLAKAGKVDAWAKERGHSSTDAAIGWLLAHPVVTSVIAGARSPEQLTSNIKAAEWTLTSEERDELSTLVARL